MKFFWRLWSSDKHNHWLLKLAVGILLLGLAFRLFFYKDSSFDPELENPFVDSTKELKTTPSPPPPPLAPPTVSEGLSNSITPPFGDVEEAPSPSPVAVEEAEGENPQGEKDSGRCDYFVGDWIPNPSGPAYTNASCFLIDGHQNCMRNGRPDSGYLYWRWNPRNCELPPFDAQRFLELMRNKSWALIGDSISRNHVQSLLCMLASVEQPLEVYHDEQYKSKRWHFPSYNFTISNIWSPFLLEAAIFEDNNGVSSSEVQLQFDKLDTTWTDLYQGFDYMIISTGKWFLKAAIYYENNTEVGCHICPGKNLTETGFAFAYQKALNYAMNFVATSNHTGTIFFRMSTPDHFEGGEWHNGGNCPRTSPAKAGKIGIKDLQHYLRDVEVAEFEKASAKAAQNGVNLKLLDFTNLLLTRPDGHPGAYREFHPFAEGKNTTIRDCLHWCLPGPIDYLNDIIMQLVVDGRVD